MNDECSDLRKAADEAGDKHYHAMTDWATRGRTKPLRERAYALAAGYRRSLKYLIDCYDRVKNRLSARRKLETAVEFKTLVEQDMKILDKYS